MALSLGGRMSAQNVPAILRDFYRKFSFDLVGMRGRETLRGSTENFLEFAAEMRLISKLQLIGRRFVRVSLRDEILRQTAL